MAAWHFFVYANADSYADTYSYANSDTDANSNSRSDTDAHSVHSILPNRTKRFDPLQLPCADVGPVEWKMPMKSLSSNCKKFDSEAGITLVETTCALVIILIALLGVAFSFTYAINYNAGNQSRSQGLAILQQEVEQMRAAKFTPFLTDTILAGGTRVARTVTTPTGIPYVVNVSVDNDPLTSGIQNDVDVPVPTIKEISITTQLASPAPGWQVAVPTTVVLRRVRAN